MVDRSRVLALLTMTIRRKPRLLVLNQYYWPGVEATAQLLTELCEALAEDLEIKVVTGLLHGQRGARPRRTCTTESRSSASPSTSFERSKLLARASNYATYLTSALLARSARPAARLSFSA